MPSGVNGVELKSKLLKMAAWANNEGLQREDRRRLRMRISCGRIISQYTEVNVGSHAYRPEIRRFLKLWIAFSAVLR